MVHMWESADKSLSRSLSCLTLLSTALGSIYAHNHVSWLRQLSSLNFLSRASKILPLNRRRIKHSASSSKLKQKWHRRLLASSLSTQSRRLANLINWLTTQMWKTLKVNRPNLTSARLQSSLSKRAKSTHSFNLASISTHRSRSVSNQTSHTGILKPSRSWISSVISPTCVARTT